MNDYGKFYIDGKEYRVNDGGLHCGLDQGTHLMDTYEEPISCYAEPNIQDAWQAREGWL